MIAMSYQRRGFFIESSPLFLRAFLPKTDFAFTLSVFSENVRGLAFNRKTKQLLIANRLVTEEECVAVTVLERPYKGAEVLDRKYGQPEPLFTRDQLAQLRAQEKEARAEFLHNPKPARVPNLSRALALLRVRKRDEPKHFARPATAKAIAAAAKALRREIPEAWQKVLRVSNGARIEECEIASGFSCMIVAVEELVKWRQQEADYYRQIGAAIPETSLLAMHTEIGDSIWLDTAPPKLGGDSRVVLMSHETGEAEREWGSVSDFLEELLTSETE
jgi:hypothetical protein